ncbi:protein phosphatase 2C domain-containing protein [Akkermansiaceae bacterium]|nr:protein phosphatase 2C domain-containing protein [Akkermansiaceae bacterium]
MITDPSNIEESDRSPEEPVTSVGNIESSKSLEEGAAPAEGESMTPVAPEQLVEEELADTQNTGPEADEDHSPSNDNGVESEIGNETIPKQEEQSNGPPPLPSSGIIVSKEEMVPTEPTMDTAENSTDSESSIAVIEGEEGSLNRTCEATEISPLDLTEQGVSREGPPTSSLPAITELVLDPPSIKLKPGQAHNFVLKYKNAAGESFLLSADLMLKVEWEHQGCDANQTRTTNYMAGRLSGGYIVSATLDGKTAESRVEITLPKPVWKVLEPEDQTDKVAHEIYGNAKFGDQWDVFAASVRGRLHAHKGNWREDSYAFKNEGECNILAMADGAGSASLSRIGSRIACDSSVKEMAEVLRGFQFGEGSEDQPSDSDLKKLKAYLVSSATEAYKSVLAEAHKRACEPRDLNTTFLLAIHVPWNGKHLVGAIQVGDGAIGVYEKDGSCTVLGVADHGEFSSETVFLTSKAAHPLDQRVLFTIKSDVQCIGLMSDGVSDDFFPEKTNLVNLFKESPIHDMKSSKGEEVRGIMHELAKKPKDAAFLAEWLKYVKKGSSDDRTLLLLINKQLTSDKHADS